MWYDHIKSKETSVKETFRVGYCSKCERVGGSYFCSTCGTKLKDIDVEAEIPT